MELPILQRGSCEPFKAGIHGAALALFAIMGLYNAAAWLTRRQRHLAVNAVLYSTLTIWEQRQVEHHLAERRRCRQRESEPGQVPARAGSVVPTEFAA